MGQLLTSVNWREGACTPSAPIPSKDVPGCLQSASPPTIKTSCAKTMSCLTIVKTTLISLPKSVEGDYEFCRSGGDGGHAFCGCTELTSVTLEGIGESAFEGCESLRKVRLKRAFSGCSSLRCSDGGGRICKHRSHSPYKIGVGSAVHYRTGEEVPQGIWCSCHTEMAFGLFQSGLMSLLLVTLNAIRLLLDERARLWAASPRSSWSKHNQIRVREVETSNGDLTKRTGELSTRGQGDRGL